MKQEIENLERMIKMHQELSKDCSELMHRTGDYSYLDAKTQNDAAGNKLTDKLKLLRERQNEIRH